MRRLAAVVVLTVGVLVASGVAGAAAPDTTGPPCSNVVVFNPAYTGTSSSATVTATLSTFDGVGFCSFATYTYTITDAATGAVLFTHTYSGSDLTDPTATSTPISNGPATVRISFTSTLGGHDADVASGTKDLNGPSGADFFN